jgi:hypothetical protein
MIVRRDVDRLLLITQRDHARLAGQVAAAWGNTRFAKPFRWPETIDAVAHHDNGWASHDASLALDETGEPLDVLSSGLLLSLETWSDSAGRVRASHSPYAALLVSIHVLRLSALAAAQARTRPEVFQLNKFQHRQIEVQEDLRKQLGLRVDIPRKLGLTGDGNGPDEDRLTHDYALLRAADQMSLAVLCEEATVGTVEVRAAPGKLRTTLRLERPEPNRLTVDPWPFGAPELSFDVAARGVEARPYDDSQELESALRASQVQKLRVHFTQGSQ